ncbi:MAG: HAD family phosphatase [Planctomycetaceae bacterium]|nr:HAD family phosphatase [Planctomycetaceae bacterium]
MSDTAGVIFDMDGTLIDSYEPHRQSWLIVAEKDGVTFTEEDYQKAFGSVSREIVSMLWPFEVSWEKCLEIDKEKEAVYREMVKKRFPAMPGALGMIQTLKSRGFKLAVGSSGPKENVQLANEQLGITPYLDAAVTGSDVERGKPDPEIFLTAAQKMGLAPNRCVVVEDAVPGINAARAAGMKCIAILSTGHFPEEFIHANHVIRSLAEVTPELITRLLTE